jgi:glycosyltransferase involved in cell wall biosynthesis
VVNDGSTAEAADFLQLDHLDQTYPGIPFLNVIGNEQPMGAAAARNRAVAQSDSELIAFLDDDDQWHPDYLSRQIEWLDSHPEAFISYAGYVAVDERGRQSNPDLLPLLRYESSLIHLLTESFIHTLSITLCRREAFRLAGKLDETLKIVHDQDWYARLLLNGGKIVQLDGAPLVVREMPGGLVTDHRLWFAEELRVIKRICDQDRECARREGYIRAHRSLFFTRIGILRNDYFFAARRLLEAFWSAPIRSLQIAVIRSCRNLFPPGSGKLK